MNNALRTGFEQTNQALWISKDVEAQLIYTFDWSQWLEANDNITDVDYEVAARRNDPDPLIKESEGIAVNGTKTYIELSGGQEDKVYVVTAKVTTGNGLIDRRNFRVRVEARSA
jgi:hypothetical protein